MASRQAHTTISRNALASGSPLYAELGKPTDVDSPDLLSLATEDLAQLEALGLIEVETLEGTAIHPIWSEDRQDWVPLGELQPGETLSSQDGLAYHPHSGEIPRGHDGPANYPHSGETLRGQDGTATVLSVTLHSAAQPVYNIEVHGHHVYQVGLLGLLVHNASPARCAMIAEYGEKAVKGWQVAHIIPKTGWSWAPKELKAIIKRVTDAGLIDDVVNLFLSTPGHYGTHTKEYVDDLIDVMNDRHSKEEMIRGINILRRKIKGKKYL